MLYADVCVNTPLGTRSPTPGPDDDPLGRTFTYAVPERLMGRLAPGHLAWVPFRGRRLQAVVLRLSDAAPDFATREIDALVWAQPLLNRAQLDLAHWISETYVAPLIESLRLMLPAGLSQRGRTVFARTRLPAPAGLTARQQALLDRIADRAGEWEEIGQAVRGATQRDDLEPLIALRLVSREVEFPSPPPRPKTDRQVRLLVDAEGIARALPVLGRTSKQADVLTWLSHNTPGTLDQVRAAARCTDAPVRALTERGWVHITPGSTRKESATVALTLQADALLDALVELRGSAKHRAVLNALLAHDGSAWIGWIYAETAATLDTLRDLEAAGLVTIAEEMVWRDPLAGYDIKLDHPPELTDDQAQVWERVREQIDEAARQGSRQESTAPTGHTPYTTGHRPPARTILLHGVTGSGKTEVYLRAIEEALRRGQQAVALVPEIALTPQTIRRFAARFPGKVTVWHSELGDGERFDVWRRVRTNHPACQVVVGSRSALFLPFPNLGVIVLDEEHEPSYKQERTPRYHARTTAIELGRLCGAPVILGSATPALETFYAARRGEMALLTLPKRIRAWEWLASPDQTNPMLAQVAELPPVHIVDMRQELRAGNRSMFSRALSAGLRHVLGAGQQAILYLNRRGAATIVLCRDCGHVEACPRCSVPLTLHGEGEQLICHHCNRRFPAPATCPSCGGRRIRHFGAGTERVEEAVRLEFPEARTLRWDRDVTGARGSHDAILSKFVAHEADVLIGTQMIAKGLDLPLVTLVGVIAADTGLFLPDFRATERTFQLLTQVAGRAGRSALGGEVVIQTYHPEHYAVVAASNHDYEGFYRQEMAFRREQGYPPLRRLARLTYHHGQRAKAQAEALRLAGELQVGIAQLGMGDTDLIGPAPCFFARQRDDYRWQIIIRSPDPTILLRRVAIPLGWRIDVDPVDLL
jgi:primosomal protein N' (replication factor Y)